MTSREKLAAELESVRRESRIISICVWSVAVGVMIYGVGNVYGLLTDHAVPAGIAWLLSPMVDAGLCVGLVATRGLTRYGVSAGWVGALRWITAGMTWGLNIASPLTAERGPDGLGVFIHSAGPLLLFIVVEAAAAYQQKIGQVIGDKQASLDAIERDEQADRAHRAELTAAVRRLQAERDEAVAEAQRLGGDLDAVGAETEALTLSARQEIDALRTEAERQRTRHTETVSALTAKHREELARLRAEMKTVSLTDYRQTHSRRGTAPKAAEKQTRATLSDEDAVQMLLEHNSDRAHEWSQAEARRVTGVGFSRLPRILSALADHLTACRSERHERCFGEGRSEGSDDAEERAS